MWLLVLVVCFLLVCLRGVSVCRPRWSPGSVVCGWAGWGGAGGAGGRGQRPVPGMMDEASALTVPDVGSIHSSSCSSGPPPNRSAQSP